MLRGSVEALSYCLPEEWDQKCTIMLDPRPNLDVGIRLSLLEYQELLSSFRSLKWKDAVSSGELSKIIYDVTAGQVKGHSVARSFACIVLFSQMRCCKRPKQSSRTKKVSICCSGWAYHCNSG